MKIIIDNFISLLIVFLIATEGLFPGQYVISGVAGYRWLEFIIFLYLAKHFYNTVKHNYLLYSYILFVFTLYFFLVIKASYLVFFESYADPEIMREAMRLPFFIIVPYLIYYVANKNIIYLKIILFLQVLIISIAFFQFPLTPFTDLAWQIKLDYFMANSANKDLKDLIGRVCSLYGFAIPFTYALISSAILSTYLYKKTENIIYVYVILFMLIVGAMSLTRSITIAILILLSYIFISSNKKNNVIKLILILVATYILVDVFTANTESFSRLSNTEDRSASGRVPLLLTGIYTLFNNPLGVSPTSYMISKEEMYAVFHHPNILEYSAHNGFVTMGMHFTLFGLIALLYFIYIIKKIFLSQVRKEIKNFFIIAFFAYLAQAFFHNNFIFIKDFNILMLLGLLIYEYSNAQLQRKQTCLLNK